MKNILRSLGIAAAFCLPGAVLAAPVVYNIDARNGTTFPVTAGSGLGVGFTIQNSSAFGELLTVTPVRQGENADALFTAAHRFGAPLDRWEWHYWLLIGDVADLGTLTGSSYGTAFQVGFGGGSPIRNGANGGVASSFPGAVSYQTTALAAFNLAPTYSFNLAPGQFARFYWRDDNFSDNSGGISVSVNRQAIPQSVPTPNSLALTIMALALLGGLARFQATRKA